MSNTFFHIFYNLLIANLAIPYQHIGIIDMHLLTAWICHPCKTRINQMFNPLFLCSVFRCVTVSDIPQQHISYFFQSIATHRRCRHSINIFRFYRLKYLYYCSSCCVVALIHNYHAIFLQPRMRFSLFTQRTHHRNINNSCGRIMRSMNSSNQIFPFPDSARGSLIFR